MIFSLAVCVVTTFMVCAPQLSLATKSSTESYNNNQKKTGSALAILLGKTQLNFSISPSAETKEQSWTCSDSEFLHDLLPQSGGPCDCSGGSSGFHLPRSSTRSMTSQRKSDLSFRRHLELKSTKSPSSSSSSSGKKKSVVTLEPQVCITCCGRKTTQPGTPGDCLAGGNNFASSYVGGNLFCQWLNVVTASYSTCTDNLRFQCVSSGSCLTCSGTVPLTPDECALAGSRRKLARHEENEQQKSIAMKKHNIVMAFVRIPKTGSTTMSTFLDTILYLFGWSDHLSSNKNKDHPEDPSVVVVRSSGDAKDDKAATTNSAVQQNNSKNNKKAAGNGALSCMFAHVPTTAHLGANFHDAADKETNQDAENNNKGWWNACPHIPYSGLLKQWSKSLDEWSVPKTAVVEQDDDNHGAMTTPFSFGFQAFSMVRDPFDRLVSYFSYLGKFTDTTEFLKDTVTAEQYEKIKAGDLHGWMELLHEQGGGCGLKLPYQFHYFHDDLDTAIDLIEVGKDGQAPKIFTLVTECYEASLYLLAEVVEGLEPDFVKDFVNSPGYMSNKNKNSITNQDSYGEGKEEDNLGDLRALARDWFHEDFVFYDAAVAQFKEYLAKSNVDPVHFKSCVHWEDVVAAS